MMISLETVIDRIVFPLIGLSVGVGVTLAGLCITACAFQALVWGKGMP
jgi:hypothetical protein